MRRLLPLLLAALAACQVDVEGAPCRVGYAADCPAGQGCGLDGKCSARCGEQSSAPGCKCPPNDGPEFAVAAPGSVSEPETLAPTGAAEPPECRFRSLTSAVEAAADAGGGTVIAMGGNTGSSTFGVATGETLPLDIPAGVTVTSDRSTSGATYAIRLDDATASAAVRLHAGGALSDFVVENDAGDSTRDAIELACDGTNVPVQLKDVELRGNGIDAQHKLKRGIVVKDTCGVEGTRVVVTGMQQEALLIDAKEPAVESTFLGGAFEYSGKRATETDTVRAAGVSLKQGVLKLDGVRIEGNAAYGIEAGSSSKDTALELNAVQVLRNGDTGIAVQNNRRLFIVDTTVFGNRAETMWGSPPYTTPSGYARLCGGVVLFGEPPADLEGTPTFRFERNRVYSNAGDQVLVLTSGGTTWNLGAAGCPAPGSTSMSVFGCYDTNTSPPPSTVSYRGLVAIDALAVARNVSWRMGATSPTATTDFRSYGANIDVGDPALYCALPAEHELDCSTPDPK